MRRDGVAAVCTEQKYTWEKKMKGESSRSYIEARGGGIGRRDGGKKDEERGEGGGGGEIGNNENIRR